MPPMQQWMCQKNKVRLAKWCYCQKAMHWRICMLFYLGFKFWSRRTTQQWRLKHTRTAKIFTVRKEHRNPIFHTLGSNKLQSQNTNKPDIMIQIHAFNSLFRADVMCRSCPDWNHGHQVRLAPVKGNKFRGLLHLYGHPKPFTIIA